MLTQLAAIVAVSLCNHLTLHFHHQNPCPASRVCRRTRLYAPPHDGQETCHSILGGNDATVPGLPASTSATARLCHGRGQCQRQCLGIVAHDDLHAPGQIAASIKRHYKQIQSAASSDAVARRTSPGQSLRTGPGAGRGGATSSVLGKVRRMCNLCATDSLRQRQRPPSLSRNPRPSKSHVSSSPCSSVSCSRPCQDVNFHLDWRRFCN